jgi:hypothetical protein
LIVTSLGAAGLIAERIRVGIYLRRLQAAYSSIFLAAWYLCSLRAIALPMCPDGGYSSLTRPIIIGWTRFACSEVPAAKSHE